MDAPASPLNSLGQCVEEESPVIAIMKDGLAPVAPRHPMIIGPGILDAKTEFARFSDPIFHPIVLLDARDLETWNTRTLSSPLHSPPNLLQTSPLSAFMICLTLSTHVQRFRLRCISKSQC